MTDAPFPTHIIVLFFAFSIAAGTGIGYAAVKRLSSEPREPCVGMVIVGPPIEGRRWVKMGTFEAKYEIKVERDSTLLNTGNISGFEHWIQNGRFYIHFKQPEDTGLGLIWPNDSNSTVSEVWHTAETTFVPEGSTPPPGYYWHPGITDRKELRLKMSNEPVDCIRAELKVTYDKNWNVRVGNYNLNDTWEVGGRLDLRFEP